MNTNNVCLFEHLSCGRFLCVLDCNLEGGRLHHTKTEYTWIRSGKAVGSNAFNSVNGVVLRNEKGHAKKAVTASIVNGECFYTFYPSQEDEKTLPNRMGHFEELTLYCGFYLNRSEDIECLVSTVHGPCLFDWYVYINQLERVNIRGCTTQREK